MSVQAGLLDHQLRLLAPGADERLETFKAIGSRLAGVRLSDFTAGHMALNTDGWVPSTAGWEGGRHEAARTPLLGTGPCLAFSVSGGSIRAFDLAIHCLLVAQPGLVLAGYSLLVSCRGCSGYSWCWLC